MAIEIIFIRFFEISSLIGFFLMTVYVGIFLSLIKLGLFVLGILAQPTIAVFLFYVTRCLGLILWSLGRTIDGAASYGQKLMME